HTEGKRLSHKAFEARVEPRPTSPWRASKPFAVSIIFRARAEVLRTGSSSEARRGGLIAKQKPRARPGASRPVHRVQDRAALHRKAAATNAIHQALLEPLELGDALVDARAPSACEASPVLVGGDAVDGELVELRSDLF